MRRELAAALAAGFLGGEWSRPAMLEAGARVLGRRRRWLGPLSRQVLEYYPRPPLDRPRELARVIALCPAALQAGDLRPVAHPVTPTRMVTNPWQLVELHDLADVAALLGLGQEQLAWLADPHHLARTAGQTPLQHYRVSTRTTPSGSVRVLEAPKHRLRLVQRLLLEEVVGRIPAHEAAHGFRTGRSVGSYAAPHAGQALVMRLDLEGFFASVTVGRVYGVLRTAGYPEPVAHCLAGLMTTVLPLRTWQQVPRPRDPALLEAHWRLGRRLAAPHLPQGAPTSPALANLAAYHLDVRLAALAPTWHASYTRYADDLALSSPRDWRSGTARLIDTIARIVRQEGFRLNVRKTTAARAHQRQRLAGLVINESPHVPRAEVDRLRAVLHNCALHGPGTQNRNGHPHFKEHLLGRIAWVGQHDPARGARLRAQFDAIDWPE